MFYFVYIEFYILVKAICDKFYFVKAKELWLIFELHTETVSGSFFLCQTIFMQFYI